MQWKWMYGEDESVSDITGDIDGDGGIVGRLV